MCNRILKFDILQVCSDIVCLLCKTDLDNPVEQQLFLVLENPCINRSAVEKKQALQRKFNVSKRWTKKTIIKLFAKFKQIGNVNKDFAENVELLHLAVTTDKYQIIEHTIQDQTESYIRSVSVVSTPSRSSMYRIMHNALHFFPY